MVTLSEAAPQPPVIKDFDTGNGQSPAAFAALRRMLRAYNLEDLYDWAREAFINGRSVAEIELELEDQPAVRQRYSAIFERRQKGLPPVSIADIVEYERQARSFEQLYGIPSGFIDANRLVARDVSASELNSRLALARDAISGRPDVLAQLQQRYQVGEGGALAYFLDPERAAPLLQEQYAASRLGAASARSGYGELTTSEAEQLARAGADEAGLDQLGRSTELFRPLEGDSGGAAITRQEQLGAITGDQQARRRITKEAQRRTAVFDEGGGFTRGGVGTAR